MEDNNRSITSRTIHGLTKERGKSKDFLRGQSCDGMVVCMLPTGQTKMAIRRMTRRMRCSIS